MTEVAALVILARMAAPRSQSFDLFPVHVKVFDFEDDAELNCALLAAARSDPELTSSITGKSALARTDSWVARLRARIDVGLARYLEATWPGTPAFELEAYCFFNYTNGASFVPVHDHLVEADVVAIYYAHAPRTEERHDTSYYAMEGGVLVLHDPRPESRVDRRGVAARDHFRIHPRTNRLVVHPAGVRHSVTPSAGYERLAVTCAVTVNRPELFEGYTRYRLGVTAEGR